MAVYPGTRGSVQYLRVLVTESPSERRKTERKTTERRNIERRKNEWRVTKRRTRLNVEKH
jgi:hypothetical protein